MCRPASTPASLRGTVELRSGELMSRRLSVLVFVLGAVALAAGACAAPTTGTTTTTSGAWIAAGCIDGAGSDGSASPDLQYNGTPNQRGNATISAVILGGTFNISGNGSCAGQPIGAITIVRATDPGAANAICSSLGAGTATSFTGSSWLLPTDAYSCSETITL